MEDISINLSEYIDKPIDDIQSEYIREKIDELKRLDADDLKHIEKLVNVETAILNESNTPLARIVSDETERDKLKFLVGKDIDGYPHISEK